MNSVVLGNILFWLSEYIVEFMSQILRACISFTNFNVYQFSWTVTLIRPLQYKFKNNDYKTTNIKSEL